MNRDEFLKKCAVLGIGLPFLPALLESCNTDPIAIPEFEINFSGKVLIIGAGAAGLTAGYLLARNNIDFEIIEAAPVYGGRVKRLSGFADFPIDLGAEWIHASPSVLSNIINDPSVNASIDFITYNPQAIYNYNNGNLHHQNWASNFYSEYKFKSTTWYGFFENYIAPSVLDRLSLNNPVNQIDYSGSKVIATTSTGNTFEGDRVLVTIPTKMLQNEIINFVPAFTAAKTEAINKVFIGNGIKVFIEFSERFYPDMLVFGGIVSGLNADDRIYYDAAFRKNSSRNVLALFSVGEAGGEYANLPNDQAIIDKIIEELDQIYDGKASQHYLKHEIQNWTKEPYIGGSYSESFDGNSDDIINQIKAPINKQIYFAGETLSLENYSTVHGASESAYAAIAQLLKD